ncbi:MAG: DUF1501 domain-containing protein [Gemmataceae bacterium]
MQSHEFEHAFGRREFLKLAGAAGLSWLTPLAQLLSQQAEKQKQPAKSLIVLWLQGGPSQLETFDPHPGKSIGGDTRAIATRAKNIQIAEGLPLLAEQMQHISLVRSLVSKEGDHERGTYFVKTGFRPDPTAVHPAIGAVLCKELPVGKTEIPRHVSILPGQWPARGGFLGAEYDAFKTYDPINKVPDTVARVPAERDRQRVEDLKVVEAAFARGRRRQTQPAVVQGQLEAARTMMTSEQLKAFDVMLEPERTRKSYGDTPFGRGCLAARRLIEVGVRCVEVTLDGWDSHVDNARIHRDQNVILDAAFAALIRDLEERKLLDRTVVLCAGEFGRTPRINPAGGRDHWPTGFSCALAGGGIRGGLAIGSTDPDGGPPREEEARQVQDVHATILKSFGLEYDKLRQTPIGRTARLTGRPIDDLLS